MAGYIERALTTGEEIVYKGQVNKWSVLPLGIVGLLTIWFFGLGLIFWILAVIQYKSTELAITNKRIIAKFGFISRSTIEMNLQKAESIQVHQSVLGRTFNFGSIVVSGGGTPQAPIPGITDPLAFRRAFLEAQEQGAQAKP